MQRPSAGLLSRYRARQCLWLLRGAAVSLLMWCSSLLYGWAAVCNRLVGAKNSMGLSCITAGM